MNGSLGRDKVWNQQIWSDIDKAVQEEVGRIRVAQKVFPSTVVNNALPVSTKRIVPVKSLKPGPTPDEFQPLFEISSNFQLTQAEVDGEEDVHLATSFARSAASVIADAEDTILFLGATGAPGSVDVTNKPAIPPGFVAEAAQYTPPTSVATDLSDILTAVRNGMAALNGRAQPGPYALFLSPNRYAQAFAQQAKGLLQTPGDQLEHVVTGGFYMVNSLPDSVGILVSLGGEPTRIILGTDAITAFTFTDAKGNYQFRVFERIQMVVRDGRAFQTLAISASQAEKVEGRGRVRH
jgi:uncharacterized linocin/CFP29 family protein